MGEPRAGQEGEHRTDEGFWRGIPRGSLLMRMADVERIYHKEKVAMNTEAMKREMKNFWMIITETPGWIAWLRDAAGQGREMDELMRQSWVGCSTNNK